MLAGAAARLQCLPEVQRPHKALQASFVDVWYVHS
jgi:hypothetical protein